MIHLEEGFEHDSVKWKLI